MTHSEYQYPNSIQTISVVRKEDILQTIENNIIDKEIAIDIIDQLECDAAKMLVRDYWVGIPYLVNMKYGYATSAYLFNRDFKNAVDTSYKKLSKKEFVVFRKEINNYEVSRRNAERAFKFAVRMYARKYADVYQRLCKIRGVNIANVRIYGYTKCVGVDNNLL